MRDIREIHKLGDLLDRIEASLEGKERLSLGEVLDAVGNRSFGPLLLLTGLVTLAPIIGDIPGMPTLMGLLVIITAGQLLLRREHFWLPEWLLRRSLAKENARKAIRASRPVARWMDRLARPRLSAFTGRVGADGVAVACIAIALVMPFLEFVPFSANVAGLALAIFGLSLLMNDGLLALAALLLTGATFAIVVLAIL